MLKNTPKQGSSAFSQKYCASAAPGKFVVMYCTKSACSCTGLTMGMPMSGQLGDRSLGAKGCMQSGGVYFTSASTNTVTSPYKHGSNRHQQVDIVTSRLLQVPRAVL